MFAFRLDSSSALWSQSHVSFISDMHFHGHSGGRVWETRGTRTNKWSPLWHRRSHSCCTAAPHWWRSPHISTTSTGLSATVISIPNKSRQTWRRARRMYQIWICRGPLLSQQVLSMAPHPLERRVTNSFQTKKQRDWTQPLNKLASLEWKFQNLRASYNLIIGASVPMI